MYIIFLIKKSCHRCVSYLHTDLLYGCFRHIFLDAISRRNREWVNGMTKRANTNIGFMINKKNRMLSLCCAVRCLLIKEKRCVTHINCTKYYSIILVFLQCYVDNPSGDFLDHVLVLIFCLSFYLHVGSMYYMHLLHIILCRLLSCLACLCSVN